ncbi:MAG: T9SS type A sorting domain-containing protein [Ignavibacteriae bacterium]|nr:T9SS type A sorting domain-containing protein [Ignavibacteriota bacterium]
MKKVIALLAFAFFTANCFSQWEQKSNGMGTNKIVWSMAASGNNIFAGTSNGIYLSTNNGDNWTISLNGQSGNSMFINGSNFWLGTDHGVFLSTNLGTNWVQTGLTTGSVWELTVKDNYIFVGTSGSGIYISSNNGVNWTHTVPDLFISSLAVSGNYIFAGNWAYPIVYVSTDNGLNWIPRQTGGIGTDVILALLIKDNILFAGVDNSGIFQSTNNGLNWSHSVLNHGGICCYSVKDNYIFAGDFLTNELYMTSNNGITWIPKGRGIGSSLSVWSLTINNQYIFAGTDSSVWRRPYSEVIGINNISSFVPEEFELYQNYPNPFNPTTNIKYSIPSNVNRQSSNVKLVVFDILGKVVATFVNEKQSPGVYEVTFDGSALPSGIYFYVLTSGEFEVTKKLVLIK